MRQGEAVFVDSGAWIALALTRDPLHARARELWDMLRGAGAKLHTSIPVVIETFTFLDRNATRTVALTWKDSLGHFAAAGFLLIDDAARCTQSFGGARHGMGTAMTMLGSGRGRRIARPIARHTSPPA